VAVYSTTEFSASGTGLWEAQDLIKVFHILKGIPCISAKGATYTLQFDACLKLGPIAPIGYLGHCSLVPNTGLTIGSRFRLKCTEHLIKT